MGPNCKNPPKIILKFIDHPSKYVLTCNSLTNLLYEANEITGNENYVKLLQVNLILAGFSNLEPLCSRTGSSLGG